MAFITDVRAPKADLGQKLAAGLAELHRRYRSYRVFRTTLNELSYLTERELADLGLHRSQLIGIAREAARNE